jgi:hypothetical protein
MGSEAQPPRVTRREVDRWLSYVQVELASILKGPAGELRARLVLLQRRLARWRDRLGIERRD